MNQLFAREPIAVLSALVAVVQSIIVLLVSFDVKVSDAQQAAILAAVAAVGGLVLAVYGRSMVTPVASPRDNNGKPLVPFDETNR